MDRFNGLEIPESLADALRPSTLALLVYDMQVGVLGQIPTAARQGSRWHPSSSRARARQ